MAAQRAISRGGGAFKDEARGRAELYVSRGEVERPSSSAMTRSKPTRRLLALFGAERRDRRCRSGRPVEIILDRTPFYGESGGQIGDTGTIRTETGVIDIDDTVKPTPDLFVHRGTVAEGFVSSGEQAIAKIDAHRRRAIRRNHTATHLLHRALRIVLGDETHQAGSLVAPDRLRFDFTTLDAMSPDQVGARGRDRQPRDPRTTPVTRERQTATRKRSPRARWRSSARSTATSCGWSRSTAFRRSSAAAPTSRRTGEIGPFLIASEGSVAAGVRRIEALTGDAAVERMLTQQRLLEDLGRDLRAPWHEVPAQVAAIQERQRQSRT